MTPDIQILSLASDGSQVTTEGGPAATTDGDPATPNGVRRTLVVTVVVLLALAATVGTTANVVAQQEPTVRVTDASVEPGGSTTVRVVLTSVPDGLAGYELVLSVEDRSVARITGGDYTDEFGLATEPVVSEDGRTIRLEAADVGGNIQEGSTNVTLATVEVGGESDGRTRLGVRPVQFDADGGAAMNVGVETGTVVVGEPTPTATATPEPTPTAAVDTATSTGDVSTDGPDSESSPSTPTGTTSGQGGLPLAGVGVSVIALASIALLLARRR